MLQTAIAQGLPGGYFTSQFSGEESDELLRRVRDGESTVTVHPATASSLGGVKAEAALVGDTQPVRIGADNKLYTKVGGYSLPTMSATEKGGAKLGTGLKMSGDVLSSDVLDDTGLPSDKKTRSSNWLNTTVERIDGDIDIKDAATLASAKAYADELFQSTGIMPQKWSDWQALVRKGLASKIAAKGDRFSVYRVETITEEHSGSITGVTVDKIAFIKARGEAKPGAYGFAYSTGWTENGKPVNLEAMGVTVQGTPADGDKIILTETCKEIEFDVTGCDYDVPAAPELEHSLSLLAVNCIDNCQFDAPELLWVCEASAYPDGLPAGTYNITLDHGAYESGTQEDGTYQFTTTQVIPVGGGIKHSLMGLYVSGGAYSKDRIIGGTFTTYNAACEAIESGLATTEGSGGTNLGTATAQQPQYRVGASLNFTERQYYGSNNNAESAIRQYLNSDEASGWWKKSNKFDMPTHSSPAAGFLYGLDPSFVAVLGAVKKRTRYHVENVGDPDYRDTEETVFTASMSEVGFGANSGVWETPPAADGTPKQEPYPLFKDAVNADRIKYLNDSARLWWLRGANPGDAINVLDVRTDGSLSYDDAYYARGAVPGLCII